MGAGAEAGAAVASNLLEVSPATGPGAAPELMSSAMARRGLDRWTWHRSGRNTPVSQKQSPLKPPHI